MIRKFLVLLFLLGILSPAYASSVYQIVSQRVLVTPLCGKIFTEHNGKRTLMPVKKQCVLRGGDSLYVAEGSSAVLHFPDGFEQEVDGEAEFAVTPIFPAGSFHWGSILAFLTSLF